MNWEGKCVWITGASSGIGRAAATEWARLGADVILSSRRQQALEEVTSTWNEAEQLRALVLPLDLGEPALIPGLAKQALAWKGKIDVVVHCGGISQRSLAIDTGLEVDRRVMEIDYFGTLALTKAILPEFARSIRPFCRSDEPHGAFLRSFKVRLLCCQTCLAWLF
jgi:dehydrogenase/reductase SDR family protein 7B